MRKKFVIADIRLPDEQKDKLISLGFTPILLPPSEKLGEAVASHPDMLMLFTEDALITERDYYESNRELIDSITDLSRRELILSDAEFKKEYPNDAIFNVGICGKQLFMKTDTAAKEIAEYRESRGYTAVSTKQGYPACTVLFLDGNHAITSDRGMAKILEKSGVLTTIIDNSPTISLPPHEYGFIGGCAGIYRGTVYFTGNLDAHPDCDKIKQALTDAKLNYTSLSKGELLFDLGGLRFFDEAIDNNGK